MVWPHMFFLSPEIFPFLIAAGLVLFLLLLEIILLTVGLSSGFNAAGVGDIGGPDVDVAGMSAGELAAELDAPAELAAQIEADLGRYDLAGPAAEADAAPASSSGGVLDFLGLRKLPLTIWLAIFLAIFASAGLALQSGLMGLFGWMAPVVVAGPLALALALALARTVSGALARLIPRDETSAISERSLGSRRGVVTVGTARRGSPAQVRVADGFGNTHYVMLEPLSDTGEIPEGAEVLVLRLRDGQLRLAPLA